MGLYNIYYGVRQEDFNLHIEREVEVENVHLAKKECLEFAEDLYMRNPIRDVMEIEEQDKISFNDAKLRFLQEMNENITYFIEEIIVDGDNKYVELIRHEFKNV